MSVKSKALMLSAMALMMADPIERHQMTRNFEPDPEWKRKKCKSCNHIGHDNCIWKKPKSNACSKYESK